MIWVRVKFHIFVCITKPATLCLFSKSALKYAGMCFCIGLLRSVLVPSPHRFTNRMCAVSLSTEQSKSFLVLLEMLRVLAPLHVHVRIGTICFHRKKCLYIDWDCMESSDHEADMCCCVLLLHFSR